MPKILNLNKKQWIEHELSSLELHIKALRRLLIKKKENVIARRVRKAV